MKRADIKTLPNYVGGEFIQCSNFFDNINPVNGTVVNVISEADIETIDYAVKSAHSSLVGGWADTTVVDRSKLLYKIANRIEERFEEFLDAEIADTGKPESQARTVDIPRGIENFRFFADLIKSTGTEFFETLITAKGPSAVNYSIRKPLGVIAVISPWNLPLLLSTWKIAPALACGNALIVKPSEETPSTATLLAEVMHECNVPPGVFNLVHGFGPESTGEYLTNHPDVDAITFTGESKTGSVIMKAAADTVKKISFELGGKNAAIIFADADFEEAVDGTVRSVFTNCGQICLCTERVYVEESIFKQFVEALKLRAESLKVGAPYDKSTTTGPLTSSKHQEKVISYYELAKKEGANVITGGGIPTINDECDNGFFVEPTIFTGLPETARCVKEEIFGPVCHIAPFKKEDEAIKLANDSDYGLAATVWTKDLSKAHRVAHQIEAGVVWVNTWYLRDLRTPFGGVKLSGIGREGGMHSFEFYSEHSNVCVKL